MKIEFRIAALVYIFDHRHLNYPLQAPEALKFNKLLPSVLKQHAPPLALRISNVAFSVCYQTFLKNNKGGTVEDFQTKFLTTAAGVAAYQEAMNQVAVKIKKEVTVDDINSLFPVAEEKSEESSVD